jgi:spore maturation protein CgeB
MSDCFSILYVGELNDGGTCRQRMRALEQLGHRVWPVDTFANRMCSPRGFLSRVTWKLFRLGVPFLGPLDLAGTNRHILEIARTRPIDILWVEKSLMVRPSTLRQVKNLRPSCVLIGYSPDDMASRHNQSSQFLGCLAWYDVYFTTKSFGVEELKSLGCRRVYFVPNAFDPNTHRPMKLSASRKEHIGAPVGFVGTFERERARSMNFLASQGIKVRVYGNRWQSFHPTTPNLRIEGRAVYGDDYAEVLSAFDIVLCYLRRINRDKQTTRSMEIPACGAFMLAERTDEHLELFQEGVEAEFFSSDDELLEKVRYYLAHPQERQRIAEAGRQRCLRSDYTNHNRLRWMLDKAMHSAKQ